MSSNSTPKNPVMCKVCGKTFFVTPSRVTSARYCSRACRGLKVPLVCPVCGKSFSAHPSHVAEGRRFCSRRCAFDYRDSGPEGRLRAKVQTHFSYTPKEREAFGHWFAGFTDGEGSFIIAGNPSTRSTSYNCSFSLTTRIDDLPILEEIRGYLQMGRLYSYSRKAPPGKNQPHDQVQFRIARKEDALRLVAFFDHHPLRAKKRNDYRIWRKAVMLWTDPGIHRGGSVSHPNQLLLAELQAELNAQRRL